LLSLLSGVLMVKERSSAYVGCRVAPGSPLISCAYWKCSWRRKTNSSVRKGPDCRTDPSLAADHAPKVVAPDHFGRRVTLTQVKTVVVERVYYRAKYMNSPHMVRVCR
jgi:hypothetical protein